MQPLRPQDCLLRAENATLALNHPNYSCRASLWEGFLHMKPDLSWWGCCCVTPMAVSFSPPFPLFPLEHQRVHCLRPVLICQFSPCRKTPQLGATLPADTCCNIWIHESRLLTKECTAIRNRQVWSMLPHWGRRQCWVIYTLIDTSFHSFEANIIQLMCVCPRKVRDKENASVGVWACIEMCALTSDWSVACMPPREDIGRGQTRLFQIDLSETASGRPNWLRKCNTFFYFFFSL